MESGNHSLKVEAIQGEHLDAREQAKSWWVAWHDCAMNKAKHPFTLIEGGRDAIERELVALIFSPSPISDRFDYLMDRIVRAAPQPALVAPALPETEACDDTDLTPKLEST